MTIIFKMYYIFINQQININLYLKKKKKERNYQLIELLSLFSLEIMT